MEKRTLIIIEAIEVIIIAVLLFYLIRQMKIPEEEA